MGKRVVIDELGRVKLSDFRKMIRTARASEKKMRIQFTLCGIDYKAYFLPDMMVLILNWQIGDKEKVQKIYLREVKSNLGLNPVLYFVCPYTKKNCRKLFTDGGKFFSMKAISDGYTYRDRNTSRRDRALIKGLSQPPDSYNRKPYYRGEITPYGKALIRHYKKMEAAENNMENIISLFRRRGRPKGSRGRKKVHPHNYTPGLFIN